MPGTTFLDSTELVLNMGPQHPSTHGVLRVILKLDGEKITGTDCVIGYLHRGVEKISENRTYVQFAPYVDRMDYVAAISNGLGYCLAVEKLINVEATPRAQAVRVILTELNRIASHLLWLGTHALDVGAITPLFYTMREREEILKIFEAYCGARLTTHAFRIGGLNWDVYEDFEKDCKTFCDYFLPKVDEYEELLTSNRIWVERLKGIGILSAEDCKAYGVTGPMLRSAGVKWDLRKAQPYSGYEKYDFEIPTGENADTYDRYVIRMEEMRQSVRIIRQAVEGIPEGPIMAKVPKVLKPPVGEALRVHRGAEGRTGILHRQRRRIEPVSRSRAAALLHQSAVARQDGEGRADRRHRGHHRHHRYRPRGSGQMNMRKLLRTVFLVDLIQGLFVTFRNQNPKLIYTEQYPAQRPNVAERYRGAPRLNVNPENGETLCICCDLCAKACPENLIVVGSERNEQTKRKELTIFTYDTSRCMFCGLCEDACPVDALELTQDFELASYSREGAVWDRQMLEEGPRPTRIPILTCQTSTLSSSMPSLF